MDDKAVEYWTRKELEALPSRKWDENIGYFKSLVILPTRRIHDSGYRMMDFVAVNENNIPFVRLSGCSDVIYIDGIGGWGPHWDRGREWKENIVESKSWSIDCLKTSGLLRIFCSGRLDAGIALSSFELFGYNDRQVKSMEGK